MRKVGEKIEPYLMVILARRFEAITNEMTNTVLRSARSGIVSSARDFSCSVTDAKGRIISVADGIPVHVAASGLIAKSMVELHDDIRPGDLFLNNSPYYGNTHHADFTTSVPVFYKGKHLFTANTREHQADIGNSQPTTYMPFSRDLYEEGALDFPCVKVQEDYKDIEDIIRMCRVRIRVPDQWYGDYLAQVGASRIAERRLIELCDKYGVDTVKAFIEQWLDYGERRMIEEIRKLPKGTWKAESKYDPIPGVADEGITFRVKMTIDPNEGYIEIDTTESDDCVPGGFNLCEATARAGGITGVINNLDPTIPHNDGAFSRIRFKLREGCVAGIPKIPACASIATTPTVDRLINPVMALFAELGEDKGIAEGGLGMAPAAASISGTDWRTCQPYANQLVTGHTGGPAVYGHDGWLTYGVPNVAGVMYYDSVEVNEKKFPIIYDCIQLIIDSEGAGRWRGAPGVLVIATQRHDPGGWAYSGDGHFFPPKGIHGGLAGRPSYAWKYNINDGKRIDLPMNSFEMITPEEAIVSESNGGGGFGDPLDRDPEKVRWDVREENVSRDKARDIYGVVIDTRYEQYAVDHKATEELRKKLKKEKGG
ncbi:MAG: hydantoinase B/oxoprolinase family protein [Dehalococcoidia bacterium]|nr:hydantoinase B/oxoprolinase family protein [Dehalococcoidia bacterium]